jgi:hypothetical protein
MIAKVLRRLISRAAAAGTVFMEAEVVKVRNWLNQSSAICNPSSPLASYYALPIEKIVNQANEKNTCHTHFSRFPLARP